MTSLRNVVGGRWILLPALILALVISFSEARQLRQASQGAVQQLNQLKGDQPWGGLAAQDAARHLETTWLEQPAESLGALDWALSRYPLNAEAWLLRARILRQLSGLDTATIQSLHAALSVQPHSREINWTALPVAESVGDKELVALLLRRATADSRHDTERALFIGARWFPDYGERLDQVLPDGESFLIRAVRYAREQDLPDLAEAAWQRLEQPRQPGERVLEDYLRIQRAHDQHGRVLAVLQQLDPAHRPGRLPGGDFSVSSDALRHLGWNLNMPAGVRLSRDEDALPPAHATAHPHAPLPPASLRLEFDGRENVRLNAPWVRIEVAEPGNYRLTGWWKAERLTTRSLPALELRLEGVRFRRRLDVPAASFPWQPFSIDLTIDETLPTIRFGVVRADTDAFDRYISGSLSLAGLSLEPTDAPPELEAP